MKSQPPEEDAGGTEAAAIAAACGRAVCGIERARRVTPVERLGAARQTSTRLEGEAALGVEVAKPAARRRVGADRLGIRPNYGLGGPG